MWSNKRGSLGYNIFICQKHTRIFTEEKKHGVNNIDRIMIK